VRLFEATLPNGERALLKEFPPQAADLASNELAMHKQVSVFQYILIDGCVADIMLQEA
jgi:hypothetical protein